MSANHHHQQGGYQHFQRGGEYQQRENHSYPTYPHTHHTHDQNPQAPSSSYLKHQHRGREGSDSMTKERRDPGYDKGSDSDGHLSHEERQRAKKKIIFMLIGIAVLLGFIAAAALLLHNHLS